MQHNFINCVMYYIPKRNTLSLVVRWFWCELYFFLICRDWNWLRLPKTNIKKCFETKQNKNGQMSKFRHLFSVSSTLRNTKHGHGLEESNLESTVELKKANIFCCCYQFTYKNKFDSGSISDRRFNVCEAQNKSWLTKNMNFTVWLIDWIQL